ncbi:MAG: Hsp20/alpha crystallin family protein [Anaerolineae bacterium]|nr:Hsp20/alpha crystallin family protein [Anaerolineae bacterium]
MSITNWFPWRRERSTELQKREALDPAEDFRRDMNRWFDEVWSRDFGLSPFSPEQAWSAFVPRVDVVESDKEITVTAELPGMEEEDIELQIRDNALVIRGEKEHHEEEKGRSIYRAERSYGYVQRSVPLPAEVDADKANAIYKNGVLTVTLPKLKPTQRKTISVKHG